METSLCEVAFGVGMTQGTGPMCLLIISSQELGLRAPGKETPLDERESLVRMSLPAEMED